MPERLVREQEFKSLPESRQEALFSLSCLSRNQRWADSIEWTDEDWNEHVIEHGISLVESVSDDRLLGVRRRFGLESDSDLVQDRILEGDQLTRQFLAWHLESSTDGIVCDTESNNNTSEPDVSTDLRGSQFAKLEIKRLVNTGNVEEYATEFIESSWHAETPYRPSALLLYFPLLTTEEWRARTFVRGYQDVIQSLSGWRDEWMYVRAFPAPINTTREFGALESTRSFVGDLQSVLE
mgnify:CR=1 FL=1